MANTAARQQGQKTAKVLKALNKVNEPVAKK